MIIEIIMGVAVGIVVGYALCRRGITMKALRDLLREQENMILDWKESRESLGDFNREVAQANARLDKVQRMLDACEPVRHLGKDVRYEKTEAIGKWEQS